MQNAGAEMPSQESVAAGGRHGESAQGYNADSRIRRRLANVLIEVGKLASAHAVCHK